MTPLDKERDVFENWLLFSYATSSERNEDGDYVNPFANMAWSGWSARASLAADASPLTDDLITDGDYPEIHDFGEACECGQPHNKPCCSLPHNQDPSENEASFSWCVNKVNGNTCGHDRACHRTP